ncbi:urease accessory protein UreD [Paenibacillus sp. strain BS8-2]
MDKYHTAPVKIAKAFAVHNQLAVIVMDVSPGMLEGDRYEMDWHACEGTHVMITNQSFLKVHPCALGGSASFNQRFVLEEHAVVEHMPEPVMLYRNAAFAGRTTVQLASGAIWMQADVLCPGRGLRGEKFLYREYDNRLTVYAGEELIYNQRQWIKPESQHLQSPGGWEEMTHWAYFFVFSDTVNASFVEKLQAVLEQYRGPESHPVEAAASATYKYGVVVSACSTAAWPLQELMRLIWANMREQLLGLPPLRLLQG